MAKDTIEQKLLKRLRSQLIDIITDYQMDSEYYHSSEREYAENEARDMVDYIVKKLDVERLYE